MADGDVTLGSVAVAVGADLPKLEADLRRARQIVVEFDRDMAARSGGLLQFTEGSKSAGDALATTSSKAAEAGRAAADVTDKTNRLAEAQDRMGRSSRAASDAIETEAQKTERLSSVIDRSMARMRDRETAQMRSGPLAGITSAGIPSDYRSDQGTVDAMMGTAGGKIPEDALAVTGAASLVPNPKSLKAGVDGLKEEAKAVEEVGKQTKISSLSIREIIVLIREMGRGDFTRMAGSATLLAQSFGAIEAIGAVGIFTILGLVGAVGLFGVAAIEGSKEANQLANMLQLSGDKAGYTAGEMRASASAIGEATRSSRAANLALIEDLTKSNDFTKAQIEALVLAAQQLSRATGESAEDITKDFAKMAQNPLKYAEAFQHAHLDIISPVQMAHLRELDRRGDKEGEIAELIKMITDGIARNTADNLNTMTRLWQSFMATVKNGWYELQHIFQTATIEERIAKLNTQIADADRRRNTGDIPGHTMRNAIDRLLGRPTIQEADDTRYKALVNERSQLQEQENAQNRDTAARGRNAQALDRQNEAITRVNSSYLHGIDGPRRYADDVTKLNNTLADSVRMAHGTPVATLLSAASQSADEGVRDLAAHYEQAVDHIKKQDLPVQFKADAKAAREAAAEAKRLAREAEALEKRRQQAISSAREEADALGVSLPLYRDQALSLDEVNKRKAIAQALSRVKLSAESEEGRELAAQVGRVHDLTAAIQHETQARNILEGMRERAESLDLEAKLIGKSGWALAYEEARLRALSQAMKDHIPINDDFMAKIEAGARRVADATVAVDATKFFDEIDKQISAVILEAETIGESSKSMDYATIRLRLMNEAKAKHIELTEKNIAKIEEEARLLSRAQRTAGTARRLNEYAPQNTEVTGGDYHTLDQTLGGEFKKQDDLRQLNARLAQQKKILEQYKRDSLMSEKDYQRRLTELDRQGAAERLKILHQTANLQIQAGQEIADSLASIAKDMLGEQSSAYRALFDISKVFAIAKAALAMEENIAEAMSKGFPQNIPLIAAAAAQGAIIMSDIRSIALTFADGGYVQGPGTGSSDSIDAKLSNGEFVTNAQATAQWRPLLEAINAGRMPSLAAMPSAANDLAPRFSIHNHAPGVEHEVRSIGPGEVEIIARRVVRKEAGHVVAGEIADPNSTTSKALNRHTQTKRNRP